MHLACSLEFQLNCRLKLDSRDKLTTSRSKVSACAGDAIPQITEAVGNASVAVILRSLRKISRIVQAGIRPAVKDIEEIRAERELHALLEREGLANAQLFGWISRATVIAEVRLGSGVGTGRRVCPRGGVEKERGIGVTGVVIETMQEELLTRDAIRKDAISIVTRGKGHGIQLERRLRIGHLNRETALVMEDAVGCPSCQHGSLPAILRNAESRHLIIEVEVDHLRLVDGQIGFLALGWPGRILYRYRRSVSPSAGDCSQILRQGVTEAARQSFAGPLGDLDLKRVVPGIAIALVLVVYIAKLREWP